MNEQNMNNTYPEQVKDDFEAYYGEQYRQAKNDNERFEVVQEALEGDWVTGFGSNSYYMNRQEAREMVMANIEYVANGLANEEWTTITLEDFIASDDWETLDVITRYHTLDDLWGHNEL